MSLLFGAIGVGYFIYGKKQQKVVPLVTGIALCAYPYFVTNRIALILTGVVLSIIPFVIRG